MCGIWAVLGPFTSIDADCKDLLDALRARGPEYVELLDISEANARLGFTRLAINGLTPAGHQPFRYKSTYTVCNGELYNYKELAKRWKIPLEDGTSDCAVLGPLFERLSPTALCRTLDGVFAFVHVDTANGWLYVARDPYGVRPLYEGKFYDSDNAKFPTRMWSSELKGLHKKCFDVKPFPPGTWRKYNLKNGALLDQCKYHSVPHTKLAYFSAAEPDGRDRAKQALRAALLAAVKKRLLSDRPIGALLSGGIDSSLIAAIAARELAKEGKKLHTFSIGMPGSTDLMYAQKVAAHIGSIHHNIVHDPRVFMEAIPQVVHDIESYDITTVRASVGNWLVGKYIRENTDIKVVFNGDGSDEIGGGYLYFFAAPSNEEFEEESERLLNEIHLYDVLRSDRSMAAHGLEARTPFLDKQVVETWRAIDTEFRRPVLGKYVEKQILREAFEPDVYLPFEVLWRKKEAFSDGVSATHDSWYARCAAHAQTLRLVLTEETAHNPPQTTEAAWYRSLFSNLYGENAASVIPHMWMPKWIPHAKDPSARTLNLYTETA